MLQQICLEIEEKNSKIHDMLRKENEDLYIYLPKDIRSIVHSVRSQDILPR